MTPRQLAKRVRQLGYHLEYQKYIEVKIAENSTVVKSYLLMETKSALTIGGYRVTLKEDGLMLEVLPEAEPETISIFELLEKAS
ncbi:MAG: hypothetical protein CO091_05810 [Candidatus Aquicultor secundus]|nr:MAG: hypothetical protein CO091_05810 [Candidatus Aquicultor secundus]